MRVNEQYIRLEQQAFRSSTSIIMDVLGVQLCIKLPKRSVVDRLTACLLWDLIRCSADP